MLHRDRIRVGLTLLGLVAFCTGAKRPAEGVDTDYGPFLTGSLDRDKAVSKRYSNESREQLGPRNTNGLATKAICVDLGGSGGGGGATVAFDTDLLRYAAGWTGGFVDLTDTHLTSGKGSVPMTPGGPLAFTTPALTGWSMNGTFADPRPRPFGPLPKSVAHYKGLYRHGRKVVFRYTVGDVDVLDMPGPPATPGVGGFTRTLRVGPSEDPLSVLLSADDGTLAVRVVQGASTVRATIARADGQVVLTVPPRDAALTCKVVMRRGSGADEAAAVTVAGEVEDLESLVRGGPPLWPQTVVTKGVLGADDKPYTVDTLTLPFENPTNTWMRPGGFDFFADGRVAMCTIGGDVWVCSGIDAKLDQLTWRRHAAGLYEPLGLRIVDDVVYVTGRDQITRLHDLNADGEADFYENFNNDTPTSANYHAFAFDLQTDAAGNFYYGRAGHRLDAKLPGQGSILRVSKDGSTSEVFAAGFRAPNGLGIGPGGEITASDNQGNWMPASKINLVRQGGFYGYMPHVSAAGGPRRTDFDPPLCWIPMSLDNSGGSQVWAGPKWGPLSGRMLHTSYGRASVMLVMAQEVEGVTQGGVVALPFRFDSGVMRGRVSPADGQLYLCGQRGWQTAGTRDGTLTRVRHTGKPLHMVTGFRVVPGGLELSFSQPLDPETANDPESFGVEQWNYLWSKEYGSDDYSVADPTKKGRDPVEVESAKLLPDGKTVFLAIPKIQPVMQMRVQVDVDAQDGETIQNDVYLTIHKVPVR